jgi:hypothetical protein
LSYIAVPLSLLQEMLATWSVLGPFIRRKVRAEVLFFSGGVVDIDVEIDADHDSRAGLAAAKSNGGNLKDTIRRGYRIARATKLP